ncbi:uncharacterized protein LOC117649176 [Thrips palmi]|uniref:Uncharacterized protein LOC117649176 n=1 Tax=Thrips palmi TaxID=161013 RepID=A0A6P8ZDH6_THRPL|nr:uncharacterized protein LOC117649176 [Thrips palmi]
MGDSDSDEEICCNPFNLHKKNITKNLRKISAADVHKNPQLYIGLLWCDNCRKWKAPSGDQQPTHSKKASAEYQQRTHSKKNPAGDQQPTHSKKEETVEVCSNPYKRHKPDQQVCDNLRKITAANVESNPKLVLGHLWCDSCRKYKPVKVTGDIGGPSTSHSKDESTPESLIKGLDCSSIEIPKRTRSSSVIPKPESNEGMFHNQASPRL